MMLPQRSRPIEKRLRRRQSNMTRTVKDNPSASFPSLFPGRTDLDRSYAFFSNPRVKPNQVLAPHVSETVRRCEAEGQVLVLSDGTEFQFPGDREGVGPVSGGRGFLGHVSIAVSDASQRRILGVLDTHLWVRPDQEKGKKKKLTGTEQYDKKDKESLVWMDNVRAVEHALAGRARTIHVMDSGADDYAQFSQMDELGLSVVLRLKHNRSLEDGKLFYVVSKAPPTILERRVHVAGRNNPEKPPKRSKTHPDRDARWATLHIAVATVTVPRPHTSSPAFQSQVTLNVVRVYEPDPPKGVEPIEWHLATNLPVQTLSDITHVVDIYRARWVVEEFFKALKSGCRVEARQLETGHALMNMVAFFEPIAAKLLGLRDAARHQPAVPAHEILDATELKVLRRVTLIPLSESPTAHEAMLAIAKLGGHLKSNGEPGWSVLARGYLELLNFVRYQRVLEQEDAGGTSHG